jgi:pilus assembly protein CpaB
MRASFTLRMAERIGRLRAAILARRGLLMALGAVGFGALAVLGARNYIGERLAIEKARLAPRPDMVEVVVARQELKRGEVASAQTMAVRSIPLEYAPGGAVTPARFDEVAGARLQVPMKPGEPLLQSALVAAESAAISTRLQPGVRAMTIAVDEVNSLSGMLQPGDRIDLLLTVRPLPVQGQLQPEFTRTVIQDVPVLATGRQRAPQAEDTPTSRSYTAITVEVDPERAQKLVVAQRSGKLTAVLRHPNDREAVVDKRLDVNTLLGLPPPSPAPAPVLAAPASAASQAPMVPAPPPGPQIIVGGRGPLGPQGSAQGSAQGGASQSGATPGAGATGERANGLGSAAPTATVGQSASTLPAVSPGSAAAMASSASPLPATDPFTANGLLSAPTSVPLFR